MMMGGRTKIGIGRTTLVKAVSIIAWGGRKKYSAHDSIYNFATCWIKFPLP
jgi:hypothetical protein